MENNKALIRALIWGAILAAIAVGLFFLMYFVVLGSSENVTRLFGSLLVPPLVLALLIGGYFIVSRSKA